MAQANSGHLGIIQRLMQEMRRAGATGDRKGLTGRCSALEQTAHGLQGVLRERSGGLSPSSVLLRSLSLYQGTVLSCTLCTLAAKEASWVRSSRMMRSMYRCEGARPEAVYSMCRSGSSSTSKSL